MTLKSTSAHKFSKFSEIFFGCLNIIILKYFFKKFKQMNLLNVIIVSDHPIKNANSNRLEKTLKIEETNN